MPVAVSPINRQLGTMLGEFGFKGRDQLPCLLVNRTLTVEMIVVLGDREHALAGNVPSPEHVFEEGNYVLMFFRTTKRNHQDGVVVHACGLRRSCGFRTKK